MLWAECNGADHIRPIQGVLHRLVESQEQAATLGYVNTLDEQALLEELLEASKPKYPQTVVAELHYLLKTPFRYPPLPWGSRFGRVHEPSLFYGGLTLSAALSEAAYYRFVFFRSMGGEPPSSSLITKHSEFTVEYRTEKGIQLQGPPFDAYTGLLSHRTDYSHAQAMGTAMRAEGVQAFEYRSARSVSGELCGALFTPEAFAGDRPGSMEHWLCELTQEAVIFKEYGAGATHHFPVEDYLVDGDFPLPA